MDNLHFNLTYPDFTQQTPLHLIHQHHHHQQDPSFQDLPTSYSTFSLLPSTVHSHLHPSTVNVNKESDGKQQQLLPTNSATLHEEQSSQQQKQMTTIASATSSATPTSLNLFSPSSSPGSSSRKEPTSRTRVTRPPNAFLLFNKEMRKRLKIDNPSWTVSDISKEIGDRWRTLSQEQKHQYVILANKIKESQQALHPNAMYIRRSKAELTEAGHYEKVEKKRADGQQQQQQSYSQVMVATATGASPSPSSSSSSTTVTSSSSSSLSRTTSSASTSSSSSATSSSALMNGTKLIGTTNVPLTGMMDTNGFFVSGDTNVRHNSNGQHTYLIANSNHTQQTPAGAHSTTTTKRTRRKHKRDKNPGAPKHPLSAYMWFLTEVRSETRQSYPGSTVGQISKVCADRWHAMTQVDRLPYLTMASTDKARYAREMRVYASQNNHTMGRGTRQKYRASSPSLLLATAAGLPDYQQQHHHGLFYAPGSTTTTMTTTTGASTSAATSNSSSSTSTVDTSSSSTHTLVPTSVDHPSSSSSSSSPSYQSSTSILRNSLPGNVAMQDTMNPSELLHSPSSSLASNLHHPHHHHHHHHHHTDSY